jgi:hypothetical protein
MSADQAPKAQKPPPDLATLEARIAEQERRTDQRERQLLRWSLMLAVIGAVVLALLSQLLNWPPLTR